MKINWKKLLIEALKLIIAALAGGVATTAM